MRFSQIDELPILGSFFFGNTKQGGTTKKFGIMSLE
jgi:hypothetical protein